jgi:general secretion pathway protein M
VSSRLTATPWHAGGMRLRARLQPVLAQARSRWRSLPQRERKQLAWMIAVVIAALIWLLFIKPPLTTIRHWSNELPRLRSQAAALTEVLSDTAHPVIVTGDSSRKPAERVRISLDAAGLTGTYELREVGPALQIEFERSTDISLVMDWLLSAPASLKLTVQQVTLERFEDSGSPVQQSHVRAQVMVVANQQPGNGS